MEVVVTMRDLIYLIVCLQVIKIATCIYFHESSYVTLVAAGKTVGDSDFGYSLGYQGGEKSNLVIGAPNSDRYGRVYMCSLKEPFISNTSYCPEVDMDFEKLTPDTRTEQNPDQRFMLGTSIAATPQYFLASAPLWTGALNKITVAEPYYFVYGSCFVYANDTSHRYKGLYEEAQSKIIKETQTIAGGIGWKTLVDEVHKLILISKPSTPPFKGNILRLNIEKPLEATKTLQFEDLQAIIKLNLRYFGTSIASGKFFNTSEQIYAVSMRNIEMYGKILFLNYNSKNQRLAIMKLKKRLVTIQDSEVGTMFGAALYGADLNKDGLSELLVGAPAHSEDRTGYDTGAVHIYLGGPQESIKNYSRKRTVLGNIDGSRFGSTIAANDLDGDGIPEIFVSAPYENSGNGALYIIAGYEIYNDLIKADGFKQIPLSKLNLTQRIQNEHFKFFGHSIQVLPDLDNNGCDEMVVGAPNTNNVMLLRCIPQIRVTITSELVGTKIIREQDNDFTIKVCVNVTYYSRMDRINTHLLVSNIIIGVEAFLDRKHRIYTIDLVQKKEQYCENVVVKLNNNEQDVYRFYAKVSMDEKDLWNIKEFNKNWVTISPDSKLEAKVLEIFRYCTGDDCLPLLSTSFSWSGSTTYVVESAQNECITVRVHNGGHSSYKACVWIQLTGAQVAQIDCANREGGYLCYLPNPLNRNADHAINMTLNMRTLTSMTKYINASVRLFEDCPEPFEVNVDQSKFKTANTSITLLFKMEDISLRG
ncbi:integrin alpha-9-like [Aphomia sociella]